MSLSPHLAALARDAPFVFFGRVRRANASHVEALDREDEPSAVVRVEDVITAPGQLGDLTGRDVTVRLIEPGIATGERHLFMATSLQFGETIAVAELARVPHDSRLERELRDAVIEAKLQALDEALVERLGRADLVVYGSIREVERLPPASVPRSEGRVSWCIARLTVWRALKGQPPDAPGVVFPFARTQKWSEIPLFFEGQEGVWLLRDAQAATLAAGRVALPHVRDGFSALDTLDFHSVALLERIRLLLERASPTGRSRRR